MGGECKPDLRQAVGWSNMTGGRSGAAAVWVGVNGIVMWLAQDPDFHEPSCVLHGRKSSN